MSERRRKGEAEARVERMTWFLLVMVFGVIYLLPEDTSFPNWIVPTAGAIILLGSGGYQYVRRWRVSPITWIAGAVMLLMGLYSLNINPNIDMLGFSLIIFAAVIGAGVLTGET